MGIQSTLSKIFAFILVTGILLFGLLSSDKQYLYAKNNATCGIYCSMAIHYQNNLKEHAFDRYYFQKSLGSFIVNQSFTLAHIPLTPRNANVGLEILSALALMIAYFIWNAIAKTFPLTPLMYWFGFIALFFDQIFIKLVPYAEESPDTLAFTLGMWLILSIARKQLFGLYCVFWFALFAQPQLSLLIIPLILLWQIEPPLLQDTGKISKLLSPIKQGLSWVVAKKARGNFIIFSSYGMMFTLAAYVIPWVVLPYEGMDHLMVAWVPLSILLATIVMTWALIKIDIFNTALSLLALFPHKTVIKRFVVLTALWACKVSLVAIYARGPVMSGTGTFFGAIQVLYTFQYHAIEQPLKSWIAHLVFYGPILLWIFYYWPQFEKICHEKKYSYGCLLTLAGVAIFSTDAESRHFVAFLPLLVFLVIQAMDRMTLKTFSFFIAWSVLATRFWGEYAPITPQSDPWLFTWGPWWTVENYTKGLWITALMLASLMCVMVFSRLFFRQNKRARGVEVIFRQVSKG